MHRPDLDNQDNQIPPKFAGIVDAYSSGNYLAPEFQSRGWRCVHIQSTAQIPVVAEASFRPDDFDFHITHCGDLERTVAECRRYELVCVLAGSETGVELADKLSESLGLITNGTALSSARRNKFEMTMQAKSRGLRVIPSFKTNDFVAALDWVVDAGWPIVLKPLRSAGTDSVISCASGNEFQKAFHSVLGRPDHFGAVINEVLIQKQMEGPEYIIDTVSCNGKHHVTNAWFIKKGNHNGHSFICDFNQLLSYEEADKLGLIEYAFAVIDSLQIRNGAAHTELLMTAAGPVLIETAARLHGAGFPIYSSNCVGYSQVDLTVDSYVNQEAFNSKSRHSYELSRNLMIVELIADVDGFLESVQFLEEIERLPSFFAKKIEINRGDWLAKTIDVFTSPGHIVLIHEDPAVIWRDYCRLRRLETQGMYKVSAAACSQVADYVQSGI
jgi:biotin carboxylase